MQNQTLEFRQLFEHESSTYTYFFFDSDTRDGIIIDPVREMLERDLQLIEELGVSLHYTLETHVHADHITSADRIRKKTGAKACIGAHTQVENADIKLGDGDEVRFGSHLLKAIYTPGHTSGCTSYLVENKVMTGDALLIRGCGRTDFQEGSSPKLYESVTKKLFCLPKDTKVFPAHDYKGRCCSTIQEEKSFNPRLKDGTTVEQFEDIMSNLNLSLPKKIQIAVPANLKSGAID